MMDPEVKEIADRQTAALESIANSLDRLADAAGFLAESDALNTIAANMAELKTVVGQVCGPEIRIGDDKGFYVRTKAVADDY